MNLRNNVKIMVAAEYIIPTVYSESGEIATEWVKNSTSSILVKFPFNCHKSSF